MDSVAARLCALFVLLFLSVSLMAQPSPAATPSDPPPTAEEQRMVLARVSRESSRYQRELPNLVCTQVTHRSVDDSGTGRRWKPRDVIEVEDNYVGRFVNHKLLMIDKRAPGKINYQHLTGFLSEAAFHSLGFLPQWIFGQQAKTRFEWRNWSIIDGRKMHVFSVRLDTADSELTVVAGQESVVAGLDGLLYVDAASSLVRRFDIHMDLPADSVVEEGSVHIDYGRVTISERQYLLPLKAEVQARIGGSFRRNEIEVVRYQRYAVDTSVHFDEPAEDEIPQDGSPGPQK